MAVTCRNAIPFVMLRELIDLIGDGALVDDSVADLADETHGGEVGLVVHEQNLAIVQIFVLRDELDEAVEITGPASSRR